VPQRSPPLEKSERVALNRSNLHLGVAFLLQDGVTSPFTGSLEKENSFFSQKSFLENTKISKFIVFFRSSSI
jgi:hypothetical protein